MPPHWFIPIKASDPKQRKKDVQDGLGKHGGASLQSFWQTPDGAQLFALIQTDLPLEETRSRFDRFRDEWWLGNLRRAKDRLEFSVWYV